MFLRSFLKTNGDQRTYIITHEQLDNAERDFGLKLSNNSLANQYLPYEGEQTDFQANETNAKDNINNLTLIHNKPNESKLKVNHNVLDVIKTTGGWVSLTVPDSSRIVFRFECRVSLHSNR